VTGTALLFATLAAHEAGHAAAAARVGATLAPPLFLPSGLGLLGSFGAITRIKSTLTNRCGARPELGLEARALSRLASACLFGGGGGGEFGAPLPELRAMRRPLASIQETLKPPRCREARTCR
jgi:hypothetical protein